MMSDYEILQMRGVSLFYYFAFFIGLYLFKNKIYSTDSTLNLITVRKLLMRFSTLGLICYISSFLIFVESNSIAFLLPNTVFELIWLFLYKAIGAPLSISLVYSCTKLNSADHTKITAVGISAAFIVQALVSLIASSFFFSSEIIVTIGSVFLIVSFVCICTLLKNPEQTTDETQSMQDSAPTPSPKKDTKKMNYYSIASIFIASFMLGFLRYTVSDNYFQVELIVAFVFLFVVISFRKKKLNSNLSIVAAILCGSASILLQPLFESAAPFVILSLEGIGLILFETAAWVFSIKFAKSHPRPLSAASLARTTGVAGHFLGTAGPIGAIALRGDATEANNLTALIIVLIYMVFLAIVFEKPRIFTHLRSVKSEDAPETFWRIPSEYVAKKYQLTERETQVLEQLAQGNTMSSMEKTFFLSRNTLKMHIRHIYQKLNIHSKQEVIDLVNKAREKISEQERDPPS